MCGFTGWFDQKPANKDILQKMTQAIAHRGPDAVGYYFEKGPLAFGHRRLSIIDVGSSHQPMQSKDGRYVLAYNGEIYNFQSLRSELEAQNMFFSTQGDTEVVLKALIFWKEKALLRFQGMFAFAFWDREEETLLLARDHVGVKPLYYSWNHGRLLFASEIKALLKHPSLSREIDPKAISLYLESQYIPAPFTIYQQIQKLPPAHFLRLQKGSLELSRYWNPTYLPKYEFDEITAVETLDRSLHKSVASMLIADVPVGAFVSGGIDSSLIAALMQRESSRKIPIFHVGFEKGMPSEHEHAARVAEILGLEYHPLIVSIKDILDEMEHWTQTFDEPFGDQAAIPTLLLSRLTQGHVKVVLTGEGADEVFAGYSNYPKRLRENRFGWLGSSFSPLRWFYPLMPAKLRKNRLFKTFGRPLSCRYTTIPNPFDSELHSAYLTPSFHRQKLETLAQSAYLSCDSSDYLDRMLHVDMKLWLADDLLTKVDRATMAYSIEARVPYLDHTLIEFAARLPAHLKLKNGTTKYLLKRLAEKYLPPEIIYRPKSGFVLPLKEWIAGSFRHQLNDTLSTHGLLKRNIFQPRIIERMLKEEDSGRRQHGSRLWVLHALELWFRHHAPDYIN